MGSGYPFGMGGRGGATLVPGFAVPGGPGLPSHPPSADGMITTGVPLGWAPGGGGGGAERFQWNAMVPSVPPQYPHPSHQHPNQSPPQTHWREGLTDVTTDFSVDFSSLRTPTAAEPWNWPNPNPAVWPGSGGPIDPSTQAAMMARGRDVILGGTPLSIRSGGEAGGAK